MNYRIGIDTGGTHTDIVLLNEETGTITVSKVPTTPVDLSIGILRGIHRILGMSGAQPSRVERFVYGTTLVTNMIVQGQEIRVGLITTKGFRDILDIGKAARRWNIYDIHADKPKALIPRQLRLTVSERMNARGEVIQELDERGVSQIIDEFKRQSVKSIAVCLFHAYQNPRHEQRIGEIIHERYPEAFVSLSSQIIPEFREYERTSTTAINALVTPAMVAHLDLLEGQLGKVGVGSHPYLMQSNGGVASFNTIKQRPVNAIHSGPIAGVVGAILIARLAGFKNVITMDMGGTSCDVSLVEDYEAKMTTNSTVAGHAVKVPTIGIHTIGAGGGSIAWIDPGGGLKVGPQSAGAVPGPACYDLGETKPTVTDANLIAGRIGQDSFLGGEMRLNADLARSAIEHCIATPLGLDLLRAANGILEIANANMIKALKLVSVARGYDPRDFALVAFGGAGPMHGTRIAEELRSKTVIIPFSPGNIAALGLLAAPIRYDFVVSRITELDQMDLSEFNGYSHDLAQQAYEEMAKEGIAQKNMILLNTADLRYRGQAYEVNIPIPPILNTLESRSHLAARFHEEHRRRYGYCSEKNSVEMVNMRVTVIGPLIPPCLIAYPQASTEDPGIALLEERNVYFHGERLRVPVYLASALQPGHAIKGPAIVQDTGSTTVVFPGQRATVDPYKNMIIHLGFQKGASVDG